MQQQKIQGLGGLTLYHALISKKEFNVKIF